MKQLAANFLQNLLNKFLHLDPESKYRIQPLQGKVVTIKLLGLNFDFQLIFHPDNIELKTSHFLQPDTIIKGTPLTLLHMTLSKDRKSFFAEDVSIEGDLELGQAVIDLFDALDIDFEEYLSYFIGDIPSHQLGRLFNRVKNLNKRARATLFENMNEYLHEESNLFPAVEALNDFFHDVDTLRMDVDRIEARIQNLIVEVGSS